MNQKFGIYFIGRPRNQTYLQLLKQRHQSLTVEQLDRRCTFTNSFSLSVNRKCAGGQNEPFVSAAHERATQVSHYRSGNGVSPAFALKQNPETNERTDLQYTDTVDSAIVGTPVNSHLLKPRLPKEPLAEPLKAAWRQ
jgi:hypothetical protein